MWPFMQKAVVWSIILRERRTSKVCNAEEIMKTFKFGAEL